MQNVKYPLVSDRNQRISRNYGVLDEESGTAQRATFIINPEGFIESKMVYPREVGRNLSEVVRLLQALQFHHRTELGVPANWIPGMPGIVRDIANAGRI